MCCTTAHSFGLHDGCQHDFETVFYFFRSIMDYLLHEAGLFLLGIGILDGKCGKSGGVDSILDIIPERKLGVHPVDVVARKGVHNLIYHLLDDVPVVIEAVD